MPTIEPPQPTGSEPIPGEAPESDARRSTPAARPAATPSQRYVAAARAGPDEAAAAQPSARQGAVIGGIVAAFCAAILVVLGGAFTFTAGLIVVAFFLGRLSAIGVDAGAGDAVSRNGRLGLAVGLSLAAVAAAQVGLWLWAWLGGAGQDLLAFLDETYGVLVPLQLLLAGGAAWLKVR